MTNWRFALAECEDMSWAGFSDWRMPSVAEALSRTKPTGPSGPTSEFPDESLTGNWTSTTVPGTTSAVFSVDADGLFVDLGFKISTGSEVLRCVR